MKILASDYDNTLKRKKVSKADIAAINKFREEGNKFGIVTGRSINMIKDALRHYHIKYDFIIGINGGITLDNKGKILDYHPIDFQTALNIIADLRRLHNDISGFSDGIAFTRIANKITPLNLTRAFVMGLRTTSQKKILSSKNIAFFFTLNDNQAKVTAIYEHFSNNYDDISVVRNGLDVVDISALGVNKANAMRFVANYYDCQQVYVIGDSVNDLDMIKEFNGFAIDLAEDIVKQAASAIFSNFSEMFDYIKNKQR